MFGSPGAPQFFFAGALHGGAFAVALDQDVADDVDLYRAYGVGCAGAAQPGGVHLVDQDLLGGQEHALGEAAFVDHRDEVRVVAQLAAQGARDGDDAPVGGAAGGVDGAEVGEGAVDEGVEERFAVADVPVDRGDGGAELGGELAHRQGLRAVLLDERRGGGEDLLPVERTAFPVRMRTRLFTLHESCCNCVTEPPASPRRGLGSRADEGWYDMARVRYGARTEAEIAASREASSKLPDIWSTGVVAVWESDPDAVAAVLPPPLKPTSRPLVRANISKVDLPGYPLGAGSVAVAAEHAGVTGWYPLVMPMTHERALIGGREVFGEPKKLGEVEVERDGLVVRASLARHGIAFVEVRGAVSGDLPLPEPVQKTDFYFKFLPAVDGSGFDADPVLVHCVRNEKVRKLEGVTGDVVLRESMYDPVADLPVRAVVEITIGEKTTDQKGRVAERVSAQALLPYIHQRYDDPRQILDGPPEGSV